MAEWMFFKRKQASCQFSNGWAVVAGITSPSGDEHHSVIALVSLERHADLMLAHETDLDLQRGFVADKDYWRGMSEEERFELPYDGAGESPPPDGDDWPDRFSTSVADILSPKPSPPELDLNDPDLPF